MAKMNFKKLKAIVKIKVVEAICPLCWSNLTSSRSAEEKIKLEEHDSDDWFVCAKCKQGFKLPKRYFK